MPWRKRSLDDCNLYLVLDTQVSRERELFEITKQAVEYGVDVIQLRDKTGSTKSMLNCADRLSRLINGRIPLIINDRVDVVQACLADGVHLGQEDMSLKDARKILGPDKLIGISCQTLMHAKAAQFQGADYIGFGSVYRTQTKPNRLPMDLNVLREVTQNLSIPVFAIGGITLDNVDRLIELGVKRIAVTREISQAGDIESVVREFKMKFSKAHV